jgi:hypothetical protein
MVTPIPREPTIDRLILQRLLNKPSDELTTDEREYFLSRVDGMNLRLLQDIIAIHPTLSRHERVIAALAARASAMSRDDLGITLARCPDLLASEAFVTAFLALLRRELRGGASAQELAEEFAIRLGEDIYPALVERAFPMGDLVRDESLAFRIELTGRAFRRPASSVGGQPPSTPDDDAAARAAEQREYEVERTRANAKLARDRAELNARLYVELPTLEQVAGLDAASRVAWNETIRSEVAKSKSGALYYLRYPARDALFDSETMALLQTRLALERLTQLIDTDDLRALILRERIAEQVIERHDELIWLERVPDWLDEALIERARRVGDPLYLWEFAHRFMGPARGVQRLRLLEVLIERVSLRSEPETFSIAATLLWGNNERWKSEAHGQTLILAALRRGRPAHLHRLLNVYDVDSPRGWVRHRLRYRCLEDLEVGSRPQVKAMHYAFASANLTWASELLVDGDSRGVERALAALCLLDPPGYFTSKISSFIKDDRLSEHARHLAQHSRRIAKSKGGSDATVYGLVQFINELSETKREGDATLTTATTLSNPVRDEQLKAPQP